MNNYRKKPVVIQAHQWFKNGDHPDDGNETFADGENAGEKYQGLVVRYFRRPDVPGTRHCSACGETFHVHGWIDTLEGGHIVCPGDWIITGVAGERYPCKPHIFTATYEPEPAPVPAAVPSTTEETIRTATQYAHDLVVSLHRDHYQDNNSFEPFDDLLGLLSQIDNMICGWKEPAAVPQPSVADDSNAYEFGVGLLKGVIDRNVAHNPEYAAKVQAAYDWIVTVLRMYEAAPLENRKILTALRYMHDGRLVGSPTYRNSSLYNDVVAAMATLAGMAADQKRG